MRLPAVLRLKEPLRFALEEAAKARGVSLNTEAVDRLARSLGQENAIDALFGGPEIAGLCQIIGKLLREVGETAAFMDTRTINRAWWRDAYAFDQAVKGINAVLEALRPAGDPAPRRFKNDPLMDALMAEMGDGFARSTLQPVLNPDYGNEEQKAWARLVRAKLGAVLERKAKRSAAGEQLGNSSTPDSGEGK